MSPFLLAVVGLIPVVGPCISLWLSHKMVCSKLSDLKLSHERQAELQQKMVATMSQDFLVCLPHTMSTHAYMSYRNYPCNHFLRHLPHMHPLCAIISFSI